MKLVLEFWTSAGCSTTDPLVRAFQSYDEYAKQRSYERELDKNNSKTSTHVTLSVQELDIDHGAGFQCIEAFELDADGKHVVDADMRLAEQIRQM